MKPEDRHEQARRLSEKYRKATRKEKTTILDAFCVATGLNRKYAIGLLRKPPEERVRRGSRRGRKKRYGAEVVRVLETIWEAADFPWSVRLKAMVPLWLPHVDRRIEVSDETVSALKRISPRTIDRLLKPLRIATRRRIYGRTKPGTLLKQQIPVRTDRWDVNEPGWGEIDLVSHSGSSAAGEFAHSINFTDIHSTWVETRAVLGKEHVGVIEGLESIRRELPFLLRGLDSDNGSEFINYDVVGFCHDHSIQFTRGRPYKKNDNAHIEQKNWTHVRRLVGWDRIDTREAVDQLNELYRHECRWMMNLFQPSVKLVRKERIGSRIRRVYDEPATPLDRLLADTDEPSAALRELVQLRDRLDPFRLSDQIQARLTQVHRVARRTEPPQGSPKPTSHRGHPLLDPPPQGGRRPHPELDHGLR